MATVSGIWRFNETLETPTTWTEQTIKWASVITENAISGRQIRVYTSGTSTVLAFYNKPGDYSPMVNAYHFTSKYGVGWQAGYKAYVVPIDFGDTEQVVSDAFYEWLKANAKREYYDITATYKGDLILNMGADQSATIECAGSFMFDDITVKFDVDGNIFYNGEETTVKKGQTATIKCAGLLMRNNVYINAQGIPTTGGNTVIISNGSALMIETAPVVRASENTIIIGG